VSQDLDRALAGRVVPSAHERKLDRGRLPVEAFADRERRVHEAARGRASLEALDLAPDCDPRAARPRDDDDRGRRRARKLLAYLVERGDGRLALRGQ
jgi:hypothetical protein